MSIAETLKTILGGYGRSARKISALILFFLIAGGVSLIIIYPLWLFATQFPQGYTLFCGLLILAALLVWTFLKVRSRKVSDLRPSAVQEQRSRSHSLRNRCLKTAGKAAAAVLSLYLTILIYGFGYPLAGTMVLAAAFFLNGWLLYGNKGSRRGR